MFGLKMKKFLTALLYVALLGILLFASFSRLLRGCHRFF